MIAPLGIALAVCAAGGVRAPAAWADGEAEELLLADGLLEQRFYELAEVLYQRAIARGGSGKMSGEIGLVKVRKHRARNERDPEVQKKLFDEAITKLKEILKGGVADVDSKFQLGDLLAEKGESLIAQMEIAEDEALREQLRRDAQEAYTQVNELFTEVVKDYRPKYLEAKDDEDGEIDEKAFPAGKVSDLIKAWMLQGESLFHRGRIETDKRKRDQDLKSAIELLEEFVWEFNDSIVGFWGYIFQGRAYTALGKYAEAGERFRSVLALPVNETTENARLMAYFHYAESLNAAAQFAECLGVMQTADKEYPSKLIKKPQGQSAILEWGKAMAGNQDFKGAIAKALDVVNAPVPFMRSQALGLLAEWAAMDPTVGAKIAFLQGTGLKNQAFVLRREHLVFEAIAAFHEAAQKLSTPEERAELGVRVWKEIGDAYFGLDMFYEAGLAYERGATIDAGAEAERGDCAYWWYRATQERFKLAKAGKFASETFDRGLYQEARSYFSMTFPKHLKMGNIPFYEARDKEDEEKYLEAAEAYERLDPRSEKFEIALARAGGCYYREFDRRRAELDKKGGKPSKSDLDLLGQAEKKLQAFLQRSETEDPNLTPEQAEARLDARGLSVFYLARVAEARADLEKLLVILSGFKDKFGEKQRGLVSSVLMLELQALGKLKRIDDAANKLDELREYNPRYYLMGAAQQLVASLFDGTADDLQKQGDLQQAAEYRRRAAAFFHGWIMGDEDAQKDKNNVIGVAARCAKVAEDEDKANRQAEALDFYDKAASLFQTLRENQKKLKVSASEADSIDLTLQNCRVRAAEILEANGREEDAIAAWRAVLPLLEELYAKNKKSRNIAERLANAFAKADRYDQALELFGTLLKSYPTYSESWWDVKYWLFELQYRKYQVLQKKPDKQQEAAKLLEGVKSLLENVRLVTPTLGGPEMAGRFWDLATRCGLKEGWENYKPKK